MPSPLVLPVATCAAVLLLSGVAKLRSPATVDTAFESLRVPRALDTPVVRRLLPWGEVALGAGLLLTTGWTLVVVALLSLLLFVAYLVLVAVAVRRPEPADCGCFGALGDSTVTRVTVWRNATLVLAAVLAVVAGARGAGLVPALLDEASTWGWLATAALTAAVAVLVAHRSAPAGPREPRVDATGDYVREPIPAAAVLTQDKELVLLANETRRAALLLVFLSPGCGPCGRIGPLVPGWSEQLEPLVVKAVLAGQPQLVEQALPHLAGHAYFDPYGLARQAFGAGNPSAVLLGADGQLAGGPVHGEDEVRAFVEEVAEHLREAKEAGELDVAEPEPEPEPEGVRPADELAEVTDAR